MFFNSKPRIGQELLDVPMGEMIRDMAFAIAEAQMRLDENSIEVAEMMGGLKAVTYVEDGVEKVNFQDSRVFFGKQKLTLSSAITEYNNTGDYGHKQAIRGEIDGFVEETNVKEVNTLDGDNLPDTLVDTGHTPDDSTYYFYEDGGSTTWFIYKTADSKYYVTSNPAIQLKAKDSADEDMFVYIPQRLSMMELGFAPTFYQFVDTICEVRISIKYTQEGSSEFGYSRQTQSKAGNLSFGFRRGLSSSRAVTTTQVNASYSQKYSYSAEGSSLLRTKLVPIPPPPILEERIRQQMELAREEASDE